MARRYSESVLLDIHSAVEQALYGEGTVNLPAIARLVLALHPEEGGSIAELEAQVMAVALSRNAVILFDRSAEVYEYSCRA